MLYNVPPFVWLNGYCVVAYALQERPSLPRLCSPRCVCLCFSTSAALGLGKEIEIRFSLLPSYTPCSVFFRKFCKNLLLLSPLPTLNKYLVIVLCSIIYTMKQRYVFENCELLVRKSIYPSPLVKSAALPPHVSRGRHWYASALPWPRRVALLNIFSMPLACGAYLHSLLHTPWLEPLQD